MGRRRGLAVRSGPAGDLPLGRCRPAAGRRPRGDVLLAGVGAEARAAVCLEIIDRINARSFELAYAVMHTSGQPFVMAFQAGGPHAQDRALEAVAAALAEQRRIPASVRWEKPGRGEPLVMEKDNHVVGRGVAVVIGCNTFPTWNAYPGLFASLATGNAVVVKPHPHAVLPLAITVEIAREVLADNGFDPDLVTLAAEEPGGTLATTLVEHPAVRIVDYTGGSAYGEWLEAEGARRGQVVFTEKAGVNSVVVDSTDDLAGLLANLAFSFTLYSGQMCTTPQNVYLPRDGISTDEGPVSFEDFGSRLAAAVQALTADDAKAVELLGATVNDGVRARAGSVADLAAAESGSGRVVLDSREVAHPTYADAVVRIPALVALDVDATGAGLRAGVLRPGRVPDRHRQHGAVAADLRRHGAGARRHDGSGLLLLRRTCWTLPARLPSRPGSPCPRTSPARSTSTRPRPSATTTAPGPTRPPTRRTSMPPSSRRGSGSSPPAATPEPGQGQPRPAGQLRSGRLP